MIVMLSLVRMVVLRARMSLTWPVTVPTSTRSPILMGRSASTTSPLMKLRAMFCSPNPMPTPTAPAKTARAERFKPALCSATTMPMVKTR